MLNLCCRWSAEGSSEQWQKKSNLMKSDQWSTSFWKGELSSLDSAGDLHSSSSSSVIWPQIFFSLSSPTAPQDIIRATQHASPLHHLPFSILSFSSPHPHISTLLPLFFPPSLPPSSFPGPRVGAAITGGGMDSFALMWFGLQHGTAQSDTLSQCTELLSLSFSPCVQFMCFQTGQSTPLSCDGLSLPLPPTISALSMSVKKPPAISLSLSHTYTLLSLVANSQCHTAAIFFIFSSPLHFVVSFLHFFSLQTSLHLHIFVFLPCFCLFCWLPANPLLR